MQNPAAHHSYIHLHFPFPIADSHARAPKTLILQAFTIGFEVSLFQGWLCEKRRVSVLRCFRAEFLFGVMVSFRWGMQVQVNMISHVLPHGNSFCIMSSNCLQRTEPRDPMDLNWSAIE